MVWEFGTIIFGPAAIKGLPVCWCLQMGNVGGAGDARCSACDGLKGQVARMEWILILIPSRSVLSCQTGNISPGTPQAVMGFHIPLHLRTFNCALLGYASFSDWRIQQNKARCGSPENQTGLGERSGTNTDHFIHRLQTFIHMMRVRRGERPTSFYWKGFLILCTFLLNKEKGSRTLSYVDNKFE